MTIAAHHRIYTCFFLFACALGALLARIPDLQTALGVNKSQLGLTLILFVLIYTIVFGAGFVYLLRLIRIGPQPDGGQHPQDGGPGRERQPMRPLSAATEPDATTKPHPERS